ncbi:hypothetical protein, partial [Escherichia coli]|uniref:hypothetical protein n=1 Tax=Escherichia coli TaxID=562 RepID=UPI001BD43665
CYGIKIDHAERETTGVEGKAERLTWHKAWTAVSSGFSISYTWTFVPGHDYLCSMSPHDRLNIQNITFPKKPEMIKNELNVQ